MIDEKNMQPAVTNSVEQVLGQLANAARVDTVFGQPVEREGATIIPCAEVAVGLGMGTGSGPMDEQGRPMGGGGGGGGGGRGRPVAVVVMTREGVRVEPVLDLTKIALASFSTGAFILFWIARLTRLGRSGKGPSFSQLKRAIES